MLIFLSSLSSPKYFPLCWCNRPSETWRGCLTPWQASSEPARALAGARALDSDHITAGPGMPVPRDLKFRHDLCSHSPSSGHHTQTSSLSPGPGLSRFDKYFTDDTGNPASSSRFLQGFQVYPFRRLFADSVIAAAAGLHLELNKYFIWYIPGICQVYT